jgi:hypothetical protein
MRGHKDKKFGERLSTAADAKKAMLDKFRARPPADDPSVVARQEARQAVSDARDARLAEQEIARAEEEAARQAQEAHAAAERDARELAEQERRSREAAEALEREAALEIERKAARDARYAARKARK